jgi:LuxR family maltose regulon positive regulatory protein
MGHGRAILTSSVSYLALARLAGGSPEGALEAVRTVQREVRAAGVSGVDGALAEIEARVSLMSGDIAAATRWADGAAGVASGSGVAPASPAQALAQTITCARVRIAQGRTDEAAQLLRRARSMAEASHDVADLISVEVLAATVAERSGDRRRAQRALEEAIARAAPERYVRRIVDDGGGVAHLLPAVRRIAPAFVDEVAAALAAGQPSQAAPARAGGAAGALWQDEDGRPVEALTARELDVLRLMARGCSDAAVADELVVSLATAKWHAARIRAKFGARSRTQALLRAQQLGLV